MNLNNPQSLNKNIISSQYFIIAVKKRIVSYFEPNVVFCYYEVFCRNSSWRFMMGFTVREVIHCSIMNTRYKSGVQGIRQQ